MIDTIEKHIYGDLSFIGGLKITDDDTSVGRVGDAVASGWREGGDFVYGEYAVFELSKFLVDAAI